MRLTMRTTTSLAITAALAGALPGAAQPPAPQSRAAQTKTTPPGTRVTKQPPVARRAGARISPADVAGRWAMRVMLMSGDSTLVTHELEATAGRDGWMLRFPNRPPIPIRVVAVAGDSIVTEAGPYESVLRGSGIQVTTRGVYRLRNGRLLGTTVAHYATQQPDSVLRVRSVGTRLP